MPQSWAKPIGAVRKPPQSALLQYNLQADLQQRCLLQVLLKATACFRTKAQPNRLLQEPLLSPYPFPLSHCNGSQSSSLCSMMQAIHTTLEEWLEALDRGFRMACPIQLCCEKIYFEGIAQTPPTPNQLRCNLRKRRHKRLMEAVPALLSQPKFQLLAENTGALWAPKLSRLLEALVEALSSAQSLPPETQKLKAMNLQFAQELQAMLQKAAANKTLLKHVMNKHFEKREQRALPPVALDCALVEVRGCMPSGLRLVSNRASSRISEEERLKLLEAASRHWAEGPLLSDRICPPHVTFPIFSMAAGSGYLGAVMMRREGEVRVYLPGIERLQRRAIGKALLKGRVGKLRLQEEARFIDMAPADYVDLGVILWTVAMNMKDNRVKEGFKRSFPLGSNLKDLLQEGFIWEAEGGPTVLSAIEYKLHPRVEEDETVESSRQRLSWLSRLGCSACSSE